MEAKEDVVELGDFLRDPLVSKAWWSIPRGVLMAGFQVTVGSISSCYCGEAKVSFFSISASDFVENVRLAPAASRVAAYVRSG